MKRGLLSIGLILVLILVLGSTGYTQEVSLAEQKFKSNNKLRFGLSQLNGKTQYEINYSNGVTMSKLEFPVDSLLGTLEYSVDVNSNFLNKLNIGGMKAGIEFTLDGDDAGDFKDTDYDTDGNTIIYSEAKTDVEVLKLNLQTRSDWHETANVKYSYLLGVKYDEYEFNIYDAMQYLPNKSMITKDKALDYEVEYLMPYIGVVFENNLGSNNKFELTSNLKYSPWTGVEDRDDHILRNKVGKSDANGNTIMFNLGVNYKFNKKTEGYFTSGYVKSNVDGEQDQYFYGDDPGTSGIDETGIRINNIDYEAEKETWHFDFGVNYKF